MSDFFVAAAGAAAALAGLVIVAVSVSVDKIITIPGMTSRAAVAIGLLAVTTIISLACLIEQAVVWTGVEVLGAGIAAFVLGIDSTVRVTRGRGDAALLGAISRAGIAIIPAALYLVSGLIILAGHSAAPILGLGTLLAILVSVLITWVILVEIKR